MQHKNIDTLEKEWKDALEWITYARKNYVTSRDECDDAKFTYKNARSDVNAQYRNWAKARKEALRAYRRYKSYPYHVRKWNIKNMEKALSMIMEKKL